MIKDNQYRCRRSKAVHETGSSRSLEGGEVEESPHGRPNSSPNPVEKWPTIR